MSPTCILDRLLLLFILLLTFPVIVLLILYRHLIVACSRLYNTSPVQPLTGLDHAFSTDSFYTRPRGGTSFIWICEGILDPALIEDRFSSVIEKDKYNLAPTYSRLTSLYPSALMSIMFWKRSSKPFQMKNHLRIITPSLEVENEQSQLNMALVEWMRTGFCQDQPLWEVLVMPRIVLDGKVRSVLGLKIHHSIGDGYSKLGLLEKIIDYPPPEKDELHHLHPSTFNFPDFLQLPSTLWKLTQDFLLHRDVWTSPKNCEEVSLQRASFPMTAFKELRTLFGKRSDSSSPPLILLGMALLAGALRRYLGPSSEEKGCNFVVALPTPDRTHPPEFCNFWSHALLNVELGEKSPKIRLQRLVDNYNVWVKENRWPQVYSRFMLPFQSLLPTWAWERVTRLNMGAPFGCTNMVGPSIPVEICGKRVLEKYAYVGLLWRHSSMTCGFFSYNGKMSLTLLANRDVTKLSPTFDQILDYFFQQEMNLLKDELQ